MSANDRKDAESVEVTVHKANLAAALAWLDSSLALAGLCSMLAVSLAVTSYLTVT